MPSWIASFTMLIACSSAAIACANKRRRKPSLLDHVQPLMDRSQPSSGRSATPADINRNGRPTSFGTGGRHQSECPADIIGIRSYRDLEAMLADRGVEVDHTTLYRWIQRFAPELEKRMRRHLRLCRGPWYVDETYIRVNGQWRYLYRAVDGTGQTIDFLLSAKRDKKAAKRFVKRALGREHTRNPREVVTDRLKSYPGALREMKQKGELWRFARHRRGGWGQKRGGRGSPP